ncbi:MAG: sigma-70 family RNA polymerase sigma factor [Deltaproteobacteria bacterium]|nr:sigma-70 family RNA polymerase sigma factor [Deltaproteobacteria bacterium]
MSDDLTLLAAWREGDAAAGRTLVERHFSSMYRFFANKVAGDVDDLIQDTFLACVENRDRLRGEAGFRGYLFGIARNKLFRHWRDRRPGSPQDLSVSRLIDSQMTPAHAIAQGQEQRLLLRCLRLLPLQLQILLEMAYFEGLTDREVAAVVELPVGTVKSKLRKGRQLLHEHMTANANAELVASTHRGFDDWCQSIRRQLDDAS